MFGGKGCLSIILCNSNGLAIGNCTDVFFPILPIKILKSHFFQRFWVKTVHIDAISVGMGTGNVKGFYATCFAEVMLRYMSVEGIEG